jgi:hypothetical protein
MIDFTGVDQVVALAPAEIDAVELLASSAYPAIGSVSRCAQVFFAQFLLRPETYRLSRTLETTPSRPTEQACLNISRPSTSKLSLN